MYTVFLFVCFICYVIVGLLVGGGGGWWRRSDGSNKVAIVVFKFFSLTIEKLYTRTTIKDLLNNNDKVKKSTEY